VNMELDVVLRQDLLRQPMAVDVDRTHPPKLQKRHLDLAVSQQRPQDLLSCKHFEKRHGLWADRHTHCGQDLSEDQQLVLVSP